jgi:hypothetical protein
MEQPGIWIAIVVGGGLIAGLSAVQQYFSKTEFRGKAVMRDFCLGAFLTALIYMLIPDSVQGWLESGKGLLESAASAAKAATSSSSGKGGDIELQTGPARF